MFKILRTSQLSNFHPADEYYSARTIALEKNHPRLGLGFELRFGLRGNFPRGQLS